MNRFSVKDVFDIQGHKTSLGVKPPPFPPSTETAQVIVELIKAGFELSAIVSLDPLCASMKGENPYFGKVENPVFPDLPCLGSSCGSAASIFTGGVDFSLGTDSGGSIRAPAASVNLWSFKATSDFFPREGAHLFHSTMDSIGVIARDSDTLIRIASRFMKDEADEGIEILTIPEAGAMKHCSEKIRAVFDTKLEALSKRYTIQEILTPDFFEEAIDIRKPLIAASMKRILQIVSVETSDLKALAHYAQTLTNREIENAEKAHAQYHEKWIRIFPRKSALFTPVLPNETLEDRSVIPLNYFLVCANILDLPAVSFPEGSFAYPCSMQVMSANRRNFSVLHVAREIGTKSVSN